MAILMKDRSYMELLSPAKPAQVVGQASRDESGTRPNGDILALLSRARSASTMPSPPNTSSRASLGSPDKPAGMPSNLSLPPGSEERTMLDFKRDYSNQAPLHNSGSSAAAVGNIDESPMPRPHRPVRGGVGSRAYDAGDSMMEMFTPERDKHRPPPAQPLKPASSSVDSGQASSLAHTLATQLLERQGGRAAANAEKDAAGADRISAATHRPFVSFAASSSSDRFPGPLEPPGQASPRHTQATPALDANSKSSAPISREPVVDRAAAATVGLPSPTDCLPPAPKRPCRADAQPAAAPSTTALSGLGDIGSSVLHNLLADALTPLREQLRGEIRNLHLDMIRQGFVYQEQVRALRQECGEARELRQELEKLRRENEQLRRHVPFFSMASDHANDSALAD
ncbi:hypothetical protein GGF42_008298 [Coemansia sp. RSA 2424]|nr:hypothetical protein GGF42_008298 [Coemansia sp. RSA 2424]